MAATLNSTAILITLLIQANDAVRSFRALADLLARHPEELVTGPSRRRDK